MSNYLCLSERSTRTISIYAYALLGGFMSPKDRAIVYGLYQVFAYRVLLVWRYLTFYHQQRRELALRRQAMLNYSPDLGLCCAGYTGPTSPGSVTVVPETHSPNANENSQAADSPNKQKRKEVSEWVDQVMTFIESNGTEKYIETLFGVPTVNKLIEVAEEVEKDVVLEKVDVVTTYRKVKKGKSVRYVESGECGEQLYYKKGKRYVAI